MYPHCGKWLRQETVKEVIEGRGRNLLSHLFVPAILPGRMLSMLCGQISLLLFILNTYVDTHKGALSENQCPLLQLLTQRPSLFC